MGKDLKNGKRSVEMKKLKSAYAVRKTSTF